MKKRIFTMLVVLVLLFTFSSAVMAAPAIGTYAYKVNTWALWRVDANRYLNVNAAADGTGVTTQPLYPIRPYTGQGWMLKKQPGDGSYRVYSNRGYNANTGRGYTLNIRSGMCTVLYDNPSNRTDSEIDLNTVNTAQNIYRIKLPAYNVYLTAGATGRQCSWDYYAESNSLQKWTSTAI